MTIKCIDVSGEGLYHHEVGNQECTSGWCDGDRYPKHCKCGGLIHADFGDEGLDGYWLYKKCDKCGDNYQEISNQAK